MEASCDTNMKRGNILKGTFITTLRKLILQYVPFIIEI